MEILGLWCQKGPWESMIQETRLGDIRVFVQVSGAFSFCGMLAQSTVLVH